MSATHPYQRIPLHHRARGLPLFLALTLILMIVLLRIDVPLQTTAAPKGIVSYELAGSVTEAQRILDSWNPTARLYAAFSLGLDFLYMPAYAIVIGLACAWAAELWRASAAGGWPWSVSRWRGALMVAALCDAIENVGARHHVTVRRPRAVAGARIRLRRCQVPADRRRTRVHADRRGRLAARRLHAIRI